MPCCFSHSPVARTITAAILMVALSWACEDSPSQPPDGRFDFLGSVAFNEGDVLQSVSGRLMVAIGEGELAGVGSPSCLSSETSVYVYTLPDPKLEERMMVRRLEPERSYFDKDRSVALIKRLIGKVLPYGSKNCNSEDYMFYIIWGIPKKSSYKKCPLARILKDEGLETFLKDDFFLEDGDGRPVVVENMPTLDEITYVANFDKELRLIAEEQASKIVEAFEIQE